MKGHVAIGDVPEFKLVKQTSDDPSFKVNLQNFDYKLGRLRKFKSQKIEVNSPRMKSRNKNMLLGNFETDPVNTNLIKVRSPIHVDPKLLKPRRRESAKRDQNQFRTIQENNEGKHKIDDDGKIVLKLNNQIHSKCSLMGSLSQKSVPKLAKSKSRRKKSLKHFATENAMKIANNKYCSENQILTQRPPSNVQIVNNPAKNLNNFQQSLTHRNIDSSVRVSRRKYNDHR